MFSGWLPLWCSNFAVAHLFRTYRVAFLKLLESLKLQKKKLTDPTEAEFHLKSQLMKNCWKFNATLLIKWTLFCMFVNLISVLLIFTIYNFYFLFQNSAHLQQRANELLGKINTVCFLHNWGLVKFCVVLLNLVRFYKALKVQLMVG